MGTINKTMKNGVGTATKLLCFYCTAAVFAFVAVVAYLAEWGPSHDYGLLYLAIAGIIVLFSLAALGLVRISLWWGMQLYAWACLACIVAMVVVDAQFVGSQDFPFVIFLLCLGILSLGQTLGYRAMLPYAMVVCMLMLWAGSTYDQIGLAIIGLLSAALCASSSGVAGENVRRLDEMENEKEQQGCEIEELREALEMLADAQREQRRIKEHYRNTQG